MAALHKAADDNGKLWAMIDTQLIGHDYLEGDTFSIADLVIGCYARRWFGVEGVARPDLAHLRRWYDRISQRPGFVAYVAPPLS
jgi:glutathione S-transferase